MSEATISRDVELFWERMDAVIGEGLQKLAARLKPLCPHLSLRLGRTRGKNFLLFSYGTISDGKEDTDALIVGVDFQPGQIRENFPLQTLNISVDISEEASGVSFDEITYVVPFEYSVIERTMYVIANSLQQLAERIKAIDADRQRRKLNEARSNAV